MLAADATGPVEVGDAVEVGDRVDSVVSREMRRPAAEMPMVSAKMGSRSGEMMEVGGEGSGGILGVLRLLRCLVMVTGDGFGFGVFST